MKTIILITALSILTLSATYATNNFNAIPDTIPDLNQKVQSDAVVEDSTFTLIENELDNLNLENKSGDTTKIRIGKTKIAIIEDGNDVTISKSDDWNDDEDWDEDWSWDNDDNWTFHKKSKKDKFRPHWASFTMGLNNYVTPDGTTTLPDDLNLLAVNTNSSFEFNLNFAQIGVNLIKQRLGLVTGVGFKWNDYKFRNSNTVLVSDSTPLYFYENTDMNGKLSKLSTWYLMVPLLIEFQIPTQGEEFYISAGVEGGLKLNAYTKIKTNDKSKYKDKKDFYTTSLDYRLTARLGYGNFGIYGAYSMMPLFEKDNGPELYPVAVGVTLNF